MTVNQLEITTQLASDITVIDFPAFVVIRTTEE